jgi:hypothetical protein
VERKHGLEAIFGDNQERWRCAVAASVGMRSRGEVAAVGRGRGSGGEVRGHWWGGSGAGSGGAICRGMGSTGEGGTGI